MRNLLTAATLSVLAIVIACANTSSSNATVALVNGPSPTATPTVTPTVTPTPPEDAPRISLADAKKAFDDGTAFFVDARPAETYKQEHIKGAVNITSATLDTRLKDLPAPVS